MTRIKYKNKQHLLISSRFLIKSNVLVIAIINKKTFEYFIRDTTPRYLVKGKSSNLRSAKRYVRKHLKLLGVNIYDEVRSISTKR